MYPHERSLVNELADEPFVLLGVNSDADLATARRAVEENQLSWRSFQNQPAGQVTSIASEWNVLEWPTLVVLDSEMQQRYRGSDIESATEVVRELLEEMRGDGEYRPAESQPSRIEDSSPSALDQD